MNLHLEPQGFLGTGASLLSDISLLAYILLLVPGMLAGLVFARRGQHRPQHKWIMIAITVINWLLIIFLMVASYRFDVAQNIGAEPSNTQYLMPTLHALLGLPAQLLATWVIIGMLREDSQVAAAKARGETNLQKYWFKNAKTKMRITLTLWLATALLGIVTYLIRYEVIPNTVLGGGANVPAPAATEDIPTPEATEDVLVTPEATDEIIVPEATEEMAAPEATEESSALLAPAATEELTELEIESSEEAAEDAERATRDAFRATEDAIDDAEDAAEDATKAAEDDEDDN